MKNKKQIARILLLIARIWGALSLAFLLFMVGAHLIGALFGSGESGNGFQSTTEMLSFIFFPVSIMIGLALTWKWEGLGGIVTIVGIICFHILRPDLIFDPMIDGLAFPGFLFVLYWAMVRNSRDVKA
jgi:hypothetical protein